MFSHGSVIELLIYIDTPSDIDKLTGAVKMDFFLSLLILPSVSINSVLFEFGIILIIGIYKNQGKHP